MGNVFKLEELRARTDRELAAIIDKELDRALQCPSACALARRLLPKVYNLNQRLRLERRLAAIERSLEANSRVRAATG